MEALALSQVLERVRRSLALNFPRGIWVRAELSQVNERRGHRYLELVEKGTGSSVLAKVGGVVWSRAYTSVLRIRGQAAAEVLQAGQEVCVFVEINFHEVYGLKLVVVDWDPGFTLGQLELKRREIVTDLQQRGLLELNHKLPLPLVIQRLAVLTSSAAAGYADFVKQLEANPFGYRFELTLFDVSVQGENVEATVAAALEAVNSRSADFDAIALLRGGGSKLDLAGFDRLRIGEAIARSKLPVLVGIGHEIDQTLPDLVGHTSLKTPTALAEFILASAQNFEARQYDTARHIARAATQRVQLVQAALNRTTSEISHRALAQLTRKQSTTDETLRRIGDAVSRQIELSDAQLASAHLRLEDLDPTKVLARGYALVSKNGKRIAKAEALHSGDAITTHFSDGQVESQVL